MPDYKKMLAGCQIVADLRALEEKWLSLPTTDPNEGHLKEKVIARGLDELSAALAAQPDLDKQLDDSLEPRVQARLEGRDPPPKSDQPAHKILDEASRRLRAFCDAPGS